MDNYNDSNKTQNMLHALADGQLPAHEREKILSIIDKDNELSDEVCEIYRIKDLIQTAYPLEHFKRKTHHTFLLKYSSYLKLASYLLAFLLTLSAGYLMGNFGHGNNSGSQYANNSKRLENKVIVFLSSSEPEKLTQALYKAETLAKEYQKTNGQVYVVTSAEGIDLLNTKTTPYKQKILELGIQYPSLHFIACNNTLYQMDKAGKHVDLITSARVVPSAVDFVAKHLQKGWQYITI